MASSDRDSRVTILDLGTGSGAILLALLSELAECRGIGIDTSEGAVATARANAAPSRSVGRAEFVVGDWADGVERRFDVVVSNPPYIATAEIAGLPVEVRDHDPHVALDGGGDGLDAMRVMVSEPRPCARRRGAAFIEIGFGQAQAVADTRAGELGSPAASGATSRRSSAWQFLAGNVVMQRPSDNRGVAKNMLGNQRRTG